MCHHHCMTFFCGPRSQWVIKMQILSGGYHLGVIALYLITTPSFTLLASLLLSHLSTYCTFSRFGNLHPHTAFSHCLLYHSRSNPLLPTMWLCKQYAHIPQIKPCFPSVFSETKSIRLTEDVLCLPPTSLSSPLCLSNRSSANSCLSIMEAGSLEPKGS